VGKLAALLEVDALGESLVDQLFVDRIGELDALLFERQLLEVAAPRGLAFRLVVGRGAGRCRGVVGPTVVLVLRQRASERVELAQLLGELHLELRGVDPLRLRDEDASLEHLELEAQTLV